MVFYDPLLYRGPNRGRWAEKTAPSPRGVAPACAGPPLNGGFLPLFSAQMAPTSALSAPAAVPRVSLARLGRVGTLSGLWAEKRVGGVAHFLPAPSRWTQCRSCVRLLLFPSV